MTPKIPIRKLVEKDFLQCQNCGFVTPSLLGRVVEGQNVFECPRCGKKATEEEMDKSWKTLTKKVYAYRCEGCGNYVENTSDNLNILGLFREIVCSEYMEVNGGLHMKLIAINGHHISKLRTMTAESYITLVETRRHQIILRYLNMLAKRENTGFRNVPQENIQAYIATLDKPIGYLAYTKDERFDGLPIIRQLFVVKEERLKGHATSLVHHFLKNQCKESDKKGNLFVIESANDSSLRIFQKLGHVKIEDGEIRFINCYEIQCCL